MRFVAIKIVTQGAQRSEKVTKVAYLSPDSEVRGIVLVLVVVLDLWDFGAEKRGRSFGNYFVPSL